MEALIGSQQRIQNIAQDIVNHFEARQTVFVGRESVRARLKVIVKRILRQYGYPPDMQLLATETVLKQAEMIAKELMG
jgi:type I restriction enzyme, R subunit